MTQRQLVAIMFTDISGYTALMQSDEEAAMLARTQHREAVRETHHNHNGNIVQYFGDGTLSIFSSAVDAVLCAVDLQHRLSEEPTIPLRVGLHLGEVVLDGQDIYGDGVNIAARIESLGVPGAILTSDRLRQEIRNQRQITTQSLGSFEFKNVEEPVEVFAVTNKGIRIPDRQELKGKLKQPGNSVAVLPFVNMSADAENEYFSDGISEEILNALVQMKGIRVTARSSSFAFKGGNQDIREIGEQLKVTHVLEGSVRKAGNRVRITAQLINASDGYHLFSESYERSLEDIFQVQEEIAQAVTRQLREYLSPQDRTSEVSDHSIDTEAYDNFLKGMFYANKWTPESGQTAESYFKKAIRLKPDYADAHSFLGACQIWPALAGLSTWKEVYENALPHIKTALKLNPNLEDAYIGLAWLKMFFEWDWEGLRKIAEKVIELAPGKAEVYHVMATYNYVIGDLPTAIAWDRKGLELDPLSAQLNFFLGLGQACNGEHAEADRQMNKVLEFNPDMRIARETKGWIQLYQGNWDAAREQFEMLEPEHGYRMHKLTCLGSLFARTGKKEEAMKCLDKLLEADKRMPLPQDLSILYTYLDDKDHAFEQLSRAMDVGNGDIMMFHVKPDYEPLRDDPRFTELVSRLKLPSN